MKYIEVLLWWCAISFWMLLTAFASDYNIMYFMMYFFAGAFLILIYGMVEAIRKDRRRNKG